MSVTGTVLWFLLGGGFVGLGAFFLWRLCGGVRVWQLVVAELVPVCILLCVTVFMGQIAMAVGLLWGAVAVNLALCGWISLCFGLRLERSDWLLLVWLILGIGGCHLLSGSGYIGVYSGLGLLVVGFIALWMGGGRQHVNSCGGKWRLGNWLGLVGVLVMLMVGAWLLVSRRAVVSAVWGWPVSLFAVGCLSLFLGVMHCAGICFGKSIPKQQVLRGLMWGNVLLVTLGMGLLAVMQGGLRLPSSLHELVLPWCVGAALVTVVGVYLPKKTTRWWGGLVVALYLVFIGSLLMY